MVYQREKYISCPGKWCQPQQQEYSKDNQLWLRYYLLRVQTFRCEKVSYPRFSST